jgi:hypothetical protein
VSSGDSAFSAIEFEKSLKNIFTQFFDIFAKFFATIFESKNFEESQKVTVKVMLLQLLLLETPIEIVKSRAKKSQNREISINF